MVWDLLFGTYFRPRERRGRAARPAAIADYPRRFLGQLSAPFRRRTRRPRCHLREACANCDLRLGMATVGRRARDRLLLAALTIRDAAQQRALSSILDALQRTELGTSLRLSIASHGPMTSARAFRSTTTRRCAAHVDRQIATGAAGRSRRSRR